MGVMVLSLIVGVLAVARLTRLFTEDRLMVGYREWVLRRYTVNSLPGYFVNCPWCTSIWVAAIVMPIATLFPYAWVIALLAIPAGSMVASLILDRD